MAYSYRIEPSIGIARVGDSEPGDSGNVNYFYLSPEAIGGRPLNCDWFGNTATPPVPVEDYKDNKMRVRRQGAKFRIMRYDDANSGAAPVEIKQGPGVSIEWTVHVANKKAAWYSFSELLGNLYLTGEYSETNSYQNQNVPRRNASVVLPANRKKLIIDPGPRTLRGAEASAEFSRETKPDDYPHFSFPPEHPSQGYPINTLGSAVTDRDGRLVVVGALGRAGGDEPISSYGGADSWYDDIADGSVTCKLTVGSSEVPVRDAWVIIGSPKFAPELVNITTLDDLLYDVAVRYHNLQPGLYKDDQFSDAFFASYESDIKPILDRMAQYQWVANTQAMTAAVQQVQQAGDMGNPSTQYAAREQLFKQFRDPSVAADAQELWADNQAPALPLNSGTNSVSNKNIVKFSTVTRTQYHLLKQWAAGKFHREVRRVPGLSAIDRADVGNATGEPMSPGIEVTWSMRNPTPYDAPYHIKHRHDVAFYREHGLSPSENETEPPPGSPQAVTGLGCEPGDMTKRMAIPWQADFFACTLQNVNFSDPAVNKVNGIPLPPAYHAYWWPPQSPWDVISGANDKASQAASGLPAGIQVNYARGINSFIDMITGWKYLAFIHNQTEGEHRSLFPYFVEVERNNEMFDMATVAVGGISNVLDPTNVTFTPTWFLKDKTEAEGLLRLKKLRGEGTTLKAGEVLPKPITAHPNLGLPRNGRVIR
jgi:L-lysine 6-oxidase